MSVRSIIKEWSAPVGGMIAIVYLCINGITALSGPIKFGTQVDLASLAGRVTALEETNKTIVTSQGAMVAEIRGTKDAILDKINSMPRLTDYSDQSAHLAQLGERVGTEEVANAKLGERATSIEGRVSALEGRQPYRNPPGRQ